MKDTSISFLHSMIVIIFCLVLVGGFIFLSTRELNKDVEMANQTVAMENMYSMWEKQPKYKTKQIDVSFQYDTRQVDDMHVVNYEITNVTGQEKITQTEINVLLDCYRNDICDDVDISEKTEHLIKDYKNFIVRDDMVIVYGLYPKKSEESFGEIENNIFVISEDLFANIINPLYSKTNKKYDSVRKNFLINNADIDYSDYSNEKRITKKEEMMRDAIGEIGEEKLHYVKEDIELLQSIAESVAMIEKETN